MYVHIICSLKIKHFFFVHFVSSTFPMFARRHERACVHLGLVAADMSALAFDRDQLLESGDRSAFWSI